MLKDLERFLPAQGIGLIGIMIAIELDSGFFKGIFLAFTLISYIVWWVKK